MKLTRTSALILFALTGLAVETSGQLCGQSFNRVVIRDSSKREIGHVTVEVLGSVSDDDFKALAAAHDPSGEGRARHFEVPANVAEKQPVTPHPASRDWCGNPLRQELGVTLIKEAGKLTEGPTRDTIGFCLVEGDRWRNTLIKLLAPGFRRAYHLGSYFYGCRKLVEFTLTRGR